MPNKSNRGDGSARTEIAYHGAFHAEAGIALLATAPSIPTTDGDGTAGDDRAQNGGGAGDAVLQVLGNSACGSWDMLEALETAGHQAMVKPKPLRPAVPGGYVVDDFAYDAENGTLTCPNGVVQRISPKANVNFGAACTAVPCGMRARRRRKAARLSLPNTTGANAPTGPPHRTPTSSTTTAHTGP